MLHRVGISINDRDLKHIQSLQKRFGIKSRSEFFRELVKRYEKLDNEFSALNQCITGYIKQPESPGESQTVLNSALKNQTPEDW